LTLLNRGLFALTLTIIFQIQLFAEYLYKDEVVHRPEFTQEVEKLGSELYQKTGISLRLIMLKKLPESKNMFEYEQNVLQKFAEPTILLTFSQMDKEVDIMTNDTSLYKYFNKRQVLSPVSSAVQAFIMAITYANTFEHFNQMRKDYGGSILPLLAGKAKDEQIVGKYAGSMFNGYLDIAQQIAKAKGIALKNDPGDSSQEVILVLKTIFYGFILYVIIMYIRRNIYKIRHKDEQKK